MLLNPLSQFARRAASASASSSSAPLLLSRATATAVPLASSAAPTPSVASDWTVSSRSYRTSTPCSNSYNSSSYGANSPAPAKFDSTNWHSTTILCVRKDGHVCMIGDGMVSMGNVTIKPNAKKVRRIATKTERVNSERNEGGEGKEGGKEDDGKDDGVIIGFAGATADAFTLMERLEGKIDEYPGQLARSCVELAKGWRTDKYLRRLEASMLVADPTISLEITGNGDVLESQDGVMGVGSGAFYAMAAARALVDIPDLSAEDVARKAMNIAADMCVYTNKEFVVENMVAREPEKEGEGKYGA